LSMFHIDILALPLDVVELSDLTQSLGRQLAFTGGLLVPT
jgi:hypothetical protein